MPDFDPDIFGGGAAAQTGFDTDVFGAPKPKPTRAQIAAQVANDPISQGARDFPKQGSDNAISQAALNLLGGLVRGAGSIGATVARPFESGAENDQRRARLDENMASVGSQPDSMVYKGGKLGGEIAGTAGVGGALAAPVRAVAARTSVPALDAVVQGLQTGGFRVGDLAGTVPGALTRVGTGAAVGGASAGLVNPSDAGAGAMLGGALPGAVATLGGAGQAINRFAGMGSQPTQRTLDTARQAMDAGYVIPPSQINPSFGNRILESISGKQATEQLTSATNTRVTEGLVRQALGIADDVPLTQATLNDLRRTAGRAYAEVSSISPQAAADLEALKQARNDAQTYFRFYNRSADPSALAQARQARATAENLENWLEFHAADAGRPELIPALRQARQDIAKTYTVGRALNDASGTVDARVLGKMHEKGMPLSDGLDVAGQFASAFPKANKSPQQVGSPAVHNLNALMSMGLGGGGFMAAGPAGLAAAAVPWVAPPAARSLMFSRAAQRGLLGDAVPISDEALGLLSQPIYRASALLSE